MKFFALKYFIKYFMKYFWNISKISQCFFRLYTHPFNIFLYVKHYLSFIYAYCSSLSLSAGLLAWFACLSHFTPSKYFAGWRTMQAVLCIVHSSSSSDRADSRGPLRQPGVATTTSLRPFSTNAEGCTIADLLDPWMARASRLSPPTRTKAVATSCCCDLW